MSRGRADGLGLPVSGSGGPVAYTPVVTWAGNTITTQSGFYLKTPGKLEVWVSFVESAGTASAVLSVTIPTGYTAVTHTGSLNTGVGVFTALGSVYAMVAAAGATTQISTTAASIGVVATWVGYFAISTLT